MSTMNTREQLISYGCTAEQADEVLKIMSEAIHSPRRQLYERDLSGPCYVYCLFDPEKNRPFYFGISKFHSYRFEQHRSDPGSAAYHYLNDLLRRGYLPQQIYKIYRKCPDRNSALDLEYKLINSTPHLVNRDRRRSQMFRVAA